VRDEVAAGVDESDVLRLPDLARAVLTGDQREAPRWSGRDATTLGPAVLACVEVPVGVLRLVEAQLVRNDERRLRPVVVD
jgi:hypothetical protein